MEDISQLQQQSLKIEEKSKESEQHLKMRKKSVKCRFPTFLSRVEQIFSKIAAEDALLQNAAFFQLSARRSGQDKTTEECNQLPVFP